MQPKRSTFTWWGLIQANPAKICLHKSFMVALLSDLHRSEKHKFTWDEVSFTNIQLRSVSMSKAWKRPWALFDLHRSDFRTYSSSFSFNYNFQVPHENWHLVSPSWKLTFCESLMKIDTYKSLTKMPMIHGHGYRWRMLQCTSIQSLSGLHASCKGEIRYIRRNRNFNSDFLFCIKLRDHFAQSFALEWSSQSHC